MTIDSLTGMEFETYEEYLDHVSPVTGYTPRDPEHYGPELAQVSESALKRGQERLEVIEQDLPDPAIVAIEEANQEQYNAPDVPVQ